MSLAGAFRISSNLCGISNLTEQRNGGKTNIIPAYFTCVMSVSFQRLGGAQ